MQSRASSPRLPRRGPRKNGRGDGRSGGGGFLGILTRRRASEDYGDMRTFGIIVVRGSVGRYLGLRWS